jgi:Peptidase C13 family
MTRRQVGSIKSLPGNWLPPMLLAMAAAFAPIGTGIAANGSWQAVLAAGDDAEPVFDDATRAVAQRLRNAGVPAGNIHRLSASATETRTGVEPATAETLLRRIATLPVRPGDHCFVFLTSHGEHNAGLWLARSQRALHPEELAQALSRACATAPTVVVVSSCYSGGFSAGAMAKPNRIILTASRRDRPSFGCAVERTYTFFDGCLLAALPKAANWQAVFAATRGCVAREEHARGERPSDPQAYFGAAAAHLPAGF